MYVAVSEDLYYMCKCLHDGTMYYRVPTEVYESRDMARRGFIQTSINILYAKINELKRELEIFNDNELNE